MIDNMERTVSVIVKARKDDGTLLLAVGALVALGISVGALAVYEQLMKRLEAKNLKEDHEQYTYEPEDESY